ncbi:hypothetical protein TWF481_001631 [Arthrobotrys musiformis]|uniref:Cyanovirin-N domain-containing protein n=1 Tax=Arthrobotrys musiformis TaxID=47236 RepID=A0AAV9VTV0_9PEZI
MRIITPLFLFLPLTNLTLPVAALPAGGPEPPVQARPPSGTLDHLSPYCQLSLWQHGPGNGASWNGFPLSYPGALPPDVKGSFNYDENLNNQCVNIFELNPENLASQISSCIVTGWCECEFFARQECLQTLFTAANRRDDSLWDRGNVDNRIQSYKCWYTQHEDRFDWCTVTWQGVDAKSFEHINMRKQVVWKRGPRYQDVIDKTRIGKCRRIPDRDHEDWQAISSIVFNGCTCNLYREESCMGEGLGSYGNSGSTILKDSFSPLFYDKGIRSYMCFHPVGVQTADRSDIDTAGNPDLPPEVEI